jgi:outer membrane receptor protein involved in Fe transport
MKTRHSILGLAVSAALTGPHGAMAEQPSATVLGPILAEAQAATAAPGSREASGTLHGRVLDAERGAFLAGAFVRVLGTGREARTDRDGRFLISGLAAGDYELEIDYLGYPPRRFDIRVAVGEALNEQFHLGAGQALDEIVVHGIRDTQLRSLNRQRASDNITNVVSADSIGRFADKNVAEALARVPGVAVARDQGEGRYISVRGTPTEFNAVALDGVILPAPDPDTRAVDLDTIPTDIVSSLEITKALTPNMDADSRVLLLSDARAR